MLIRRMASVRSAAGRVDRQRLLGRKDEAARCRPRWHETLPGEAARDRRPLPTAAPRPKSKQLFAEAVRALRFDRRQRAACRAAPAASGGACQARKSASSALVPSVGRSNDRSCARRLYCRQSRIDAGQQRPLPRGIEVAHFGRQIRACRANRARPDACPGSRPSPARASPLRRADRHRAAGR